MSADLGSLLAATQQLVDPLVDQMGWAEEEIRAAQLRHPDQAERVYHGFALLWPTSTLMSTEAVYRAHCGELLDRVAGGDNTRVATSAELACAASEASLVAPLTHAGFLSYARAFNRVFPGSEVFPKQDLEHYEHVSGEEARVLGAKLTMALRAKDRTLAVNCSGVHHGEPAPHCPFVQAVAA